MNRLLGVNLLGSRLEWDQFLVIHHKFLFECNDADPWLYEESRLSMAGASLSNSGIVVTNKLDQFQTQQ